MNEYRDRATGQVVPEAVFRNKFPDSAFPPALDVETLNRFGFDPVMISPQPVATSTQNVIRDGVHMDVNGNWTQTWTVIDLPSEAIAAHLAASKAAMWDRIQAVRDRLELGGVLVEGKWFHTDLTSEIKYLKLQATGANMPTGVNWTTMDGSAVPMTPALLAEITDAAMTTSLAIHDCAVQHKAAMEAALEPLSYDFTTGWPEVYADVVAAALIAPK